MLLYEVLMYGALVFLIGMAVGWIAYRKVIKYDKKNVEDGIEFYKNENSRLEQHIEWLKQSNQACYDQGYKDGQKGNIKEVGKAMLSDSYVLKNGTMVSPAINFYRPGKLGPR